MMNGKRVRRLALNATLVACLAAVGLACLGCATEESKLLRHGQEFNAGGRYASALECYNQVLAKNPNSARAYEYRGLTYFSARDFRRAIVDLSYALHLDPKLVDAYVDRGSVYTEMNDYDRARSDFDMALMLDPESAKAYNNRGTLFCKQKKFPQAVADYQRSIELAPGRSDTYSNLGLTYLDMQDYVNARKSFETALKLSSGSPVIRYYLGLTSARAKDYARAEQEFTTVIKMKPNFVEALQARCLARFYMKKYDDAMSDLRQVEALGTKLNPEFEKQLQEAREGKKDQ